jgi:hypothetical protein
MDFLDEDGSGKLDFEEFLSFMAKAALHNARIINDDESDEENIDMEKIKSHNDDVFALFNNIQDAPEYKNNFVNEVFNMK